MLAVGSIFTGIRYLPWWSMENRQVHARLGWVLMTVCALVVATLTVWAILLRVRRWKRDLTA